MQDTKFTGKERDAETGLDYFEARYFSGAQGRFTSADAPFADQDEANPQSWNLYSYGRNNPLRFFDFDGRKCVQTDGGGWADDGTGGGCDKAGVDENGKIAPQQVTVGVGRDEANLIMLSMIGDAFTNPHAIAQLVTDAGRATASIALPGASAVAQCAAGGIAATGCDKTNLAMAAIPGIPGTSMQRFVKNRKLLNILTAWNRTGAGIGTGSTADAIRHEIQTGAAVGGKFHFQKGEELRRALVGLLRNPSLDPGDKAIVKELLIDLQSALSTPRR